MKYVLAVGRYREFRGYVFAHGKPVDITDRGTLEAIAADPEFKEVKDEPPQKDQAPAAPVLTKRPTLTLSKRK